MANNKKYDYTTAAGAAEYLSDVQANPQPTYTSQYDDKIKNTLSGIENSKYSYSAANDPAYQAYQKQYTRAAKSAMNDTLAAASELTGGYGNSYGQTAAQRAYSDTMKQLTDIIPTLEQNAYNRYQSDLANKYNLMNAYASQEASDYGRYRDRYNDYNDQIARAYNYFSGNRDYEASEAQRAFDNRLALDNQALTYEQWQHQLDQDAWNKAYNERQLDMQEAQAAATAAYNQQKLAAGDGSGKSESADTSGILDSDQVKDYAAALQGMNSRSIYDNLISSYKNGNINDIDFKNILLKLGITNFNYFVESKGLRY